MHRGQPALARSECQFDAAIELHDGEASVLLENSIYRLFDVIVRLVNAGAELYQFKSCGLPA
jgi:hypothetical protein